MSISSEINRIQSSIASAYSALSDKGAEMPISRNSYNLTSTIGTLPTPLSSVTVRSKNLLNPETLTRGKELNWSNGAITDNANRNITDYIPVTPGKYLVSSYYINRVLKPYSMIAVCYYDEEKQYLSGIGNKSCVTIPAGAVYARVCGNSYMPQTDLKVQLELSDEPYPTFFEPYRAEAQGLANSVIEANRIITRDNVNGNFYLALPRILFCTAGKTLRLYHRNLLSHPKYNIAFYSANKKQQSDTVSVTVKNYDDYVEFVTSGSGVADIPFAVYDSDYNQVVYDNIELKVTDADAPDANVLIIGDSTVELDDILTTQLNLLYSSTSSELTLLGTRGNTGKKHEGRTGWKAEDYVTAGSKSNVTNAFWDGEEFSFSYYMEQQQYDRPDAVVIQLGINDIFYETIEDFSAETIIGYISEMVDSVKQYSPDIKIAVNLVTPPNSNGSSFADKYHGTQIEWLYRYNTIRYNRALADHYRDDSSVTVLGINTVLDTNTDIRDGVHPKTVGLAKIAGVIYDYLANELEVSNELE